MELVVGPEHDLHLLDGASIPGEHVVHPRAHQAGAELGEGPAQVRGLADLGAALLEHDLVRAGLLEAGHREAGVGTEPDLRRHGQERLGAGHDLVRRHQLLHHGGLRAVTEHDERAPDRRIAAPRRPSGRRSAGPAGRRPGRAPGRPATTPRATAAASLSSDGQQGTTGQQVARQRVVGGDQLAQGEQPDAGRAGRIGQGGDGHAVLAQLQQPGDAVRQPGRGGQRGRGAGDQVRRGTVERRGTQVHVRRVELAVLHGQRLEQGQRGEAVLQQPARARGARRPVPPRGPGPRR